ncbi:helix-turn-helix transcriptional regulator [Methylomonas sp. EFPC1]|uniref:helix-turn-helix domain-containing protein n=1 Tax=Methylomonas sp. EFPC1 TaxID=2812647 RepID=UPI0019681BA4|nr:helix-turn-helix transcriptional regulator [Methylomonas sp. EFPC1]QSB03447.1 helix-turn-helix transcriptional regulator [Methylomonas sp. EFPC1]
MSTIGNRLKEERKRLKLSQPAFGELGGVQKQAQLKYEKDERSPDSDYLAGIARAGVDIVYVLTGLQTGSSASNPREAALLDNFRHSGPEVQVGVSKLLAETGRALERANAISESVTAMDMPPSYTTVDNGLIVGVHSNAVHHEQAGEESE